jgi:hypothetical protein
VIITAQLCKREPPTAAQMGCACIAHLPVDSGRALPEAALAWTQQSAFGAPFKKWYEIKKYIIIVNSIYTVTVHAVQ